MRYSRTRRYRWPFALAAFLILVFACSVNPFAAAGIIFLSQFEFTITRSN